MRPKSFQLLAVVALVIIALVALLVAVPSPVQAKKASTIVVGTSPPYPPYEMYSGNSVRGFDIDLMKEIAKRAGFKVQWQVLSWEDLFTALRDRTVDMAASAITILPDDPRNEYMDYSDPYAPNPVWPTMYLGLGFPKGSELRTVVNAALQIIGDDGTYVKLYEKWFGVTPSFIP